MVTISGEPITVERVAQQPMVSVELQLPTGHSSHDSIASMAAPPAQSSSAVVRTPSTLTRLTDGAAYYLTAACDSILSCFTYLYKLAERFVARIIG